MSTQGQRLQGVDAARGLALLAMMSVHIIPSTIPDGSPHPAFLIAAGRASALFALLLGVGLALTSGAATPVTGRAMARARAGGAGRAVALAAIGLLLGSVDPPVAVILVQYALLLLVATAFLSLRPDTLLVSAFGIALVVPQLSFAVRDDLPAEVFANPSWGYLVDDPVGMLQSLTLTGVYPASSWMAYVLLGLAVGRLPWTDPSQARLWARRLIIGGGSLALLAWISSWVLLRSGGFAALVASTDGNVGAAGVRVQLLTGLFGTTPTTTPWWLAVVAPHSTTTLDLLHTMGTGLVVLGVAQAVAPRTWLRPLAAAGAMTLTLYTAHALALAWLDLGLLPLWTWTIHAGTALLVGWWWQTSVGRGPLEAWTTGVARRTAELLPAPHDSVTRQ